MTFGIGLLMSGFGIPAGVFTGVVDFAMLLTSPS